MYYCMLGRLLFKELEIPKLDRPIFTMHLHLIFLIQFALILVVHSYIDSLFVDEAYEAPDWVLSNFDLAGSTSVLSEGEFDSGVNPHSSFSSDPASNLLIDGEDIAPDDNLDFVFADEQNLDWVASDGGPCVSNLNDFQSIGKLRARQQDSACPWEAPGTTVRDQAEDPSKDSSNENPDQDPTTRTNRGGEPLMTFYPSENEDQCPPSRYGNRKTPMCDSGYAEDFMKYSVLGFSPLEMIEGCLPCT
jgi:hypothetical protein